MMITLVRSLRNNNIRTEGAKAIADALASGKSVMKRLVLSFNAIADEGAISLGESIKTNKSLEELQLFRCEIGPDGAKADAALSAIEQAMAGA